MSIKAPVLRQGDTVGIVSPSFGALGLFPHRLENGIAQLERMGFKVKVGPHARNSQGYVSDSAENRAADLHEMFADPEVRAIIAGIGGDHSNQLLPLLDFDLIRRNPTIFMGYSDITVLNVALHVATGLVTFNGPALATDFGEFPRIFDYTEAAFRRTVMRAEPAGPLPQARWWTEEFQNWEEKLDLVRPRQHINSPGWSWLKPGLAEGHLLGGCFASLHHLKGTPWWPDFQGAILFLESSEECSGPAQLDSNLMDYQNMGVFDQIKGLIVGRPYLFSDDQKAQLREIVLARTAGYDFPIITDMDFGHTAPQLLLPLGIQARIDSANQEFSLLEAAVI